MLLPPAHVGGIFIPNSSDANYGGNCNTGGNNIIDNETEFTSKARIEIGGNLDLNGNCNRDGKNVVYMVTLTKISSWITALSISNMQVVKAM